VASPKRSSAAYSQLRALDIAKRMIDYGVYPPTVYFPMTVPEAMMFEPTETESKRSLDELADVIQAIMEEGAKDPEMLHSAPHQAPVGRVDEVTAARHPKLRWRPESNTRLSREADDRRQLLALMLKRAFRVGDFVLTSGQHSPYYFDGRLVTLDPWGALLVGRAMLKFAREDGLNQDWRPHRGSRPDGDRGGDL